METTGVPHSVQVVQAIFNGLVLLLPIACTAIGALVIQLRKDMRDVKEQQAKNTLAIISLRGETKKKIREEIRRIIAAYPEIFKDGVREWLEGVIHDGEEQDADGDGEEAAERSGKG